MNQLILGSLLGDMTAAYGCKNSRHPRIMVGHSINQKDYVDLKYEILKDYVLTPPKSRSNTRGYSKNGILYSFSTRSLPIFTYFYDVCYSNNGKKKVTTEWLNQLTEEGLSYWYMDDGSGGKMIKLATCSFDYNEHLTIQKYFAERWNIKTDIDFVKSKYWQINICGDNKNKFSELVKPWIIKTMEYKLCNTNVITKCVICENIFISKNKIIKTCSKTCSNIRKYRMIHLARKRKMNTDKVYKEKMIMRRKKHLQNRKKKIIP